MKAEINTTQKHFKIQYPTASRRKRRRRRRQEGKEEEKGEEVNASIKRNKLIKPE